MICGESGSVRDLEHVLWEMRVSVVMQLVHWKLRFQGVWTVEPEEPAGQRAERLIAAVEHGQADLQT